MNDPLSRQLSALNSLLHVEQEARLARDVSSLGFIIANKTYNVLSYKVAAFGTQTHGGRTAISSLSGSPDVDQSAPFVLWLTSVIKAVAKSKDANNPTIVTAADFPEELHRGWREWGAANALYCPLKTNEGQNIGFLWMARDEAWSANDVAIAEHLCGAYGHALSAFGGSPLSSLMKMTLSSKAAALGVICTAILLSTIRVDQSVMAPVTVIPQTPLVIASPLEGVVEAMDVQPNEPVQRDQVLFHLNKTVAVNHYEVAQKALQVVEAELLKTQQLAFSDKRSKGELALLRAEISKKTAEVAYAKQLLDQTVIRAPKKGVAVFNDPNDWAGRPVRVGERVLTIADPENVQLEIMLPANDAISLETGNRVWAFMNFAPLSPIEAKLSRYS